MQDQEINDEIMRQVGVTQKQLVEMVENSDYVVYVNEKVQKAEKVVEEEPKNKYNSLEEEY